MYIPLCHQVSAIRAMLVPPSPGPLDLSAGQDDPPDGPPTMLDQTFFHEQLKVAIKCLSLIGENIQGGFFIEAGAYDGVSASNSLHYELKHQVAP